jgi:predicted phosphodiesterase
MVEKKSIKTLGRLDGKLLFFGGIYSNLQSLEALKTWAETNEYQPENIFCTGDILGYCAQPLECIELLKDWGIKSIAGNVELQIRNDENNCGCDFTAGGRCDLFSKNWYSYIQSKISAETKEWLNELPEFIQFEYGDKKITVLHGSWFNTSEFIFKSTSWQIKQANFQEAQSEIIIAGHCGLPFIDVRENLTWINAGVIGMPPNDGTPRVWFVTLDNNGDEPEATFHSYTYNHQKASSLMIENNLPASYAATLATGLWDNCEILPEEETNLQGQAISFDNY